MVINVMIIIITCMNRVSHLKWTWIRSSLLLFRGFLLMDVMFPRRKVEKMPTSSFFVIEVPWNHYPKTGASAASLLICLAAAAAFAATWCTSSLSSSVSVSCIGCFSYYSGQVVAIVPLVSPPCKRRPTGHDLIQNSQPQTLSRGAKCSS